MYSVDIMVVVNPLRIQVIWKYIYDSHYQVNTRFFRIHINSIYKIYMPEYEGIRINHNYSK